MAHRLRVLVDSTYILPAFGIEVEGLTKTDLEKLDELHYLGRVTFYYSDIIWIEVIPKVIKEYEKAGFKPSPIMINEVALMLQSTFKKMEAGSQAIVEALKLRQLGHRDMIDNLLYGIALENDLYLLTMDVEFKKFLSSHNLKHEILITHRKLLNMLT